jgi:hypothetical protein
VFSHSCYTGWVKKNWHLCYSFEYQMYQFFLTHPVYHSNYNSKVNLFLYPLWCRCYNFIFQQFSSEPWTHRIADRIRANDVVSCDYLLRSSWYWMPLRSCLSLYWRLLFFYKRLIRPRIHDLFKTGFIKWWLTIGNSLIMIIESQDIVFFSSYDSYRPRASPLPDFPF